MPIKKVEFCGSSLADLRLFPDAAKLEKFIYVLHCFQKKTQKTANKDLDLAKSRYAELMRELRDEN